MKLGTLRDGTRDGTLVVVSRAGDRYAPATAIARTLQAALDEWERLEPRLRELSAAVEQGSVETTAVDPSRFHAPLPRAYEWVDGSAFLSHVVLVRKARGAEPPPTLRTDPLVYQGGSSVLLGPTDPLVLPDPGWGLDFESEVAVVLGDTPRGTTAAEAARHVRLVLLANDVTYRNLVPGELEKGFGFFCSKPATAFSPFAVTPDELGSAFRGGRLHLRLETRLDGELVGDPDAGDPMHFSFHDLIEHVTKTRAFAAGTILGSGTVSNEDPARGVSCLAERRMREKLEHGAPRTPFLRPGNRVTIRMRGEDGADLFGAIDQRVVPA
ncbi:MAG TPA: fumarylacetoacetate hydrolase family protein [Polyangiaceae bacterium]|nr:fumarylacetoacetate hydrolase family protein [Polyangiaceae bacterium]